MIEETGVLAGVDVGGTFTDVYVFEPNGTSSSAKSATTSDTVSGALAALGQVIQLDRISQLAFGSTIATNALVERRLAKVGLLATAGFRDLLDIRRLWRPHLFGHSWDRPRAIVPRRFRLEAPGRIDWQGREIESLDEAAVLLAADRFRELEVEAVAIAFLFSFLNPVHEHRAAELVGDRLGIPVLCSSAIDPERKEYERTSTTVIAAGLQPVITTALAGIEGELRQRGFSGPLRVMKSNGGVMSPTAARANPVQLVKSGPSGGSAAGAFLSQRLNEPNLILLDIGGTTADASLIVDGQPARRGDDALEWDVPIRVPVADIRSVGAGGGSIAGIDGAGGLRVGPESAGANPGPAAYGRGGTDATVTDAAIVAGIVDPDNFLGGAMTLDRAAADASLSRLGETIGLSAMQVSAGILHLAAVEMANLIREITIDQGRDPREFSLVAFGGAGPMFVGSLMEELDLRLGIVPVGASTLSAMGCTFADVSFDYVRTEVGLLQEIPREHLEQAFAAMIEKAQADMTQEGLESGVTIETSLDLRYHGQWHELEIEHQPIDGPTLAAERFGAEHERLWGHRREDTPIELVAMRVRAVGNLPKPSLPEPLGGSGCKPSSQRKLAHYGQQEMLDALVFERARLGTEDEISGPAIVEETQTTTIVPPGARLSVGQLGELRITR